MSREPIANPILRGFNPDPSICRVGDDYYIATSTFEWYPGVRIHHSRDLRNWRLAARPLNRASLLDMRGNPDSCGVWAPCLSYCDGLFYLVYTDVKRFDGSFKDTHNYLTTCASIDGDWSDPVYLNASGFDPSLYHAEDGRKWLTNMVWDHRPDTNPFAGILLQEYSVERSALLGERRFIFRGTELGCTEAPHLYRFGEFYYLITAEGGTGYDHAVTMARSRALAGPYEADPAGPVLTARHRPDWPLQRAGHGDIVETPSGELYLVYLCSRSLPGMQRSPLGRETAIQPMTRTDDGWLRVSGNGVLPQTHIAAPELDPAPVAPEPTHDHFDGRELRSVYQWLRTPWPEQFLSLTDRPGYLRLYGMESLGSLFKTALIARRQTEFAFRAETRLEFEPKNFQQMAGLVCYYNSSKYHYLYVSTDETLGKHLGIMSCAAERGLESSFPIDDKRIRLPANQTMYLRAEVRECNLQFAWSPDRETWHDVAAVLDMSALSDEAGRDGAPNFTGSFVGLCCQDLTGSRCAADFDSFTCEPL